MVRLNGVCNAGCGFCELDGRRRLDAAGLRRTLDGLRTDAARGAHRLRISGGEPTLDPQLLAVVRAAAELGYDDIVLETNCTIVGARPDLASRLVDAGVTDAFWSVYAADPVASDAIYRLPGAHDASVSGARALAAAGARITARTPLPAPLLAGLAEVPAWLREIVPDCVGWRLRPLVRSDRSQLDEAWLPTLEDAARAARLAERAAREQGLPVVVEDDLGLPLCLLRDAPRLMRGLERHPTRDRSATHVRQEGCERCAVAGQCAGQPRAYVAAHGAFEVTPFERVPVALVARASRPETYVIYDRTSEHGAVLRGPQVTIRVVMPCNQDCTFCFVDRTSRSLTDDEVFLAIEEAAAAGASRVSFSGGEPTLHRRLPEFVARASALGIGEREIQTNALRLEQPPLVDELVAAGLTQAVVSLHAVDPERYTRITGAGRPEQVLAGVANLLARGVRVELNVVHNADNLDHLADVVAVVADRAPAARVLFSVTYIVDGLPRAWDEVAVRYADAVPELVRAMRLARERELDYRMTGRCGTPPCAWRDHLKDFFGFALAEVGGQRPERGHRYVEACAGCVAREHCYGINEAYLARFGEAEFRPVPPEAWRVAGGSGGSVQE